MRSLREIREKAGMTREQLAEFVGITPRTIQAYESGDRRPMPETAKKIADRFGLSIEEMWEVFYTGDQKHA